MDNSESDETFEEYFTDLNDGCGCAELWEYMSEQRFEDDSQ